MNQGRQLLESQNRRINYGEQMNSGNGEALPHEWKESSDDSEVYTSRSSPGRGSVVEVRTGSSRSYRGSWGVYFLISLKGVVSFFTNIEMDGIQVKTELKPN